MVWYAFFVPAFLGPSRTRNTQKLLRNPEMAIAAIGMYDPELGDKLKQHRGNLEKLQQYWRLGGQ